MYKVKTMFTYSIALINLKININQETKSQILLVVRNVFNLHIYKAGKRMNEMSLKGI